MDVRRIVPALQQSLASAPATPIGTEAPWAKNLRPDGTPKAKVAETPGEDGDWTLVDDEPTNEAEKKDNSQDQGPSKDADLEEKGDSNQLEKKSKNRRGKRGGQAHKKNKKGSSDNGKQGRSDFDPVTAINTMNPPMEPDVYKASPTTSNDPVEIDGVTQIGQLRVSSEVLGHGSQGTLVYRGSHMKSACFKRVMTTQT